MKSWTKHITLAIALGALLIAGACDSDDGGETTDDTSVADTTGGDTTGGEDTSAPGDTTATTTYATLVFTVDDSTNGTYEATDGLAWKGSFSYDDATGELIFDAAWGGPFPALYDDGTHGDAIAGDHIWTVAAKVPTPDADQVFEYGAIRGSIDGADGDWLWTGPNGSVTVPAGETGTVTATGLVIAAHGDVDLKLTLDVSNSGANLSTNFQGADYTGKAIWVKLDRLAWRLIAMVDDGTAGDDTAGDGVYTMVLSHNLAKHDGLLPEGKTHFAFQFGEDDNALEYKDPTPSTEGVKAYLDSGSGFEEATVVVDEADKDKNTMVEVGATTTASFTPPADHVAVNFCVDDTANQTYEATDGLAWKGSFAFDADTRVLAKDAAWGGPFPMLYDDGPWDAGGHEPAGATAGDHTWCVAVWVSNATADTFEYGAIRGSVEGSDGDWIWTGSNGTFDVTAGATEPIDAPGLTIRAFGTIDLRLTIDLSGDGANLNGDFQGNPWDAVEVKGTFSAWTLAAMADDGTLGDATAGDGVYTWTLSSTPNHNDGKLLSGDTPEFIFVLHRPGVDGGQEYKTTDGACTNDCPTLAAMEGVTAYLDDGAGTFSEVTVERQSDGDHNTFVTVP